MTADERQAAARVTVEGIVDRHRQQPGPLLPVLHAVQAALGFVPPDLVPVIAEGLNLSRADVHGVISFYHFFRSSPPGRHIIQVCRAESCQAMGSRQLEDHVRESLGVDYHQTSSDGQYTLLPVYCLGNCACSPAIRVGDDIHGHVDRIRFDQILKGLPKTPGERSP